MEKTPTKTDTIQVSDTIRYDILFFVESRSLNYSFSSPLSVNAPGPFCEALIKDTLLVCHSFSNWRLYGYIALTSAFPRTPNLPKHFSSADKGEAVDSNFTVLPLHKHYITCKQYSSGTTYFAHTRYGWPIPSGLSLAQLGFSVPVRYRLGCRSDDPMVSHRETLREAISACVSV